MKQFLNLALLVSVAMFVTACAAHQPGVVVGKSVTPESVVADAQAGTSDIPCYTGMIIVSDNNQVELVGCPEKYEVYTPLVPGEADGFEYLGPVGRWVGINDRPTSGKFLTPDADGRYMFPPRYSPVTTYLTVVDGVPRVNWIEVVTGEHKSGLLHPAYQVNPWVSRDRKLTPFFDPTVIGPPAVEMKHAAGDFIEGRPFHLLTRERQENMMFFMADKVRQKLDEMKSEMEE